ncbi:MAG: dihydroneopterin aldolase [Chlorobi bacterium OLB5]|nr:MAG: dihydroneopterin aldolase [Chlorobi bacterium OLB5]
MNYTIIRIRNARFYAHHGVLDAERTNGGLFEIDAEMTCDVTAAEAEDNLKKTLDYEHAYRFIKEVVSEERFFLIEALAYRIAVKIISNFNVVQKVVIKVRKPSPPLGGLTDYVEVEHTEYRQTSKQEPV